MRCKTCHYSLLNLTEHRCPECGNAFDPNDPDTFETAATMQTDRRKWRRLVIVFLFAALFMMIGPMLAFRSQRSEAPLIASVVALLVTYYGIRIYRTQPRS